MSSARSGARDWTNPDAGKSGYMLAVLVFFLRRSSNSLGAIVSADRALPQYRCGLG